MFPFPNLILVGFGREQIIIHSCLKCSKRFIPTKETDVFCENHLECEVPKSNLSSVKFRGVVVGWSVEFATAHFKRSRYNFIKAMKRDGYQCQYCGYKPGIVPEFEPLHVDHIHPFSRQGTNKLTNLATACQTCNLIASNKLFPDFLEKKVFILEKRVEKGYKRTWFQYVREVLESLNMQPTEFNCV